MLPRLQHLLRVIAQLGLDHAREALGGFAVRVLPVFLARVLRERVEEDVDLREVQRHADGVHGGLECAPVAELCLDAHAADADPVPHARTSLPDGVLRATQHVVRELLLRYLLVGRGEHHEVGLLAAHERVLQFISLQLLVVGHAAQRFEQ